MSISHVSAFLAHFSRWAKIHFSAIFSNFGPEAEMGSVQGNQDRKSSRKCWHGSWPDHMACWCLGSRSTDKKHPGISLGLCKKHRTIAAKIITKNSLQRGHPLQFEHNRLQLCTFVALAHRNHSDFCNLRLRCPSQSPEIARFPRQEKAMLHCDLRVRWKVASDLRFRAAISEPKTPSFCGISGDLSPSTRKSLAIAIVRCWCAQGAMVVSGDGGLCPSPSTWGPPETAKCPCLMLFCFSATACARSLSGLCLSYYDVSIVYA